MRELNLQKLETRREMLSKKFALKCLTNPKTSKMFPVKKNNKNLRYSEKYVITHARTERLKNTAIPYMQRQLNSKF